MKDLTHKIYLNIERLKWNLMVVHPVKQYLFEFDHGRFQIKLIVDSIIDLVRYSHYRYLKQRSK